uniref:Putative chitin synthase n=1 Tax=Pinctada fucata TaxID=50426 RepID=A0A194AMF9_PINFU
MDIPLLQQIFEDRLENIHRKWKRGTLAFRPNHLFTRTDSHRVSEKEQEMRQKMFKRSFRRIHSREDKSLEQNGQSIIIDMHKL